MSDTTFRLGTHPQWAGRAAVLDRDGAVMCTFPSGATQAEMADALLKCGMLLLPDDTISRIDVDVVAAAREYMAAELESIADMAANPGDHASEAGQAAVDRSLAALHRVRATQAKSVFGLAARGAVLARVCMHSDDGIFAESVVQNAAALGF